MIVVAVALVTSFPPPTDIAVIDWIRLGIVGCRTGHRAEQCALHLAEIGCVVSKPIPLGLKVRPRRDGLHIFRGQPLRLGEQVGIETKLQDRARFGLASELGADRLIRPGSQPARHLDAAQDIGASLPVSDAPVPPAR